MLDAVERIRGRFPGVNFVGLDSASSLDEARKDVEENGWGFPMAVDRDGAVGLLYSVGVGPTTFFAYRGGVLAEQGARRADGGGADRPHPPTRADIA